jgi:cell division protein FtsQ
MNSKHLQATARKEPWTLFHVANILPLILLGFVIVVVVWLWGRMQNPNAYPLQNVKIITSGQYIPQDKIQAIIKNNTKGGFFSLDTKQLKDSLLNNPWIQDVSIRRIWPSSLAVKITEQQPLMRWGQNGILSVNGDVFFPDIKSIPQKLPEIDAPMSAKDNIMPLYMRFNELLKPLSLHIEKLVVTDRLAWTVVLSNGISVNLCRGDTANRFTTFVESYPQLILGKAQDVVSVNLCYPNGLAIRWKSGKSPKN